MFVGFGPSVESVVMQARIRVFWEVTSNVSSVLLLIKVSPRRHCKNGETVCRLESN